MGAAEKRELPELLTPDHVAGWLGVSRKQVYNMVDRNAFPRDAIVKIGRTLRFDAVRLRAWVAEKRGSSPEGQR